MFDFYQICWFPASGKTCADLPKYNFIFKVFIVCTPQCFVHEEDFRRALLYAYRDNNEKQREPVLILGMNEHDHKKRSSFCLNYTTIDCAVFV